ncbi:uncharacterized protein BCR38DRAFT_145710 [Pseudomassariella vexata]|uniref:Uncharacterized protein n=1 Tax=Pseudomassariella vexata TaxID=1141098 RepID=A0A1Y2D843_9PEZI|nr:uncharacterized protein BCR38DRAFT_145710 [Pseudomassariella vexata]ORY54805.1 hypothetical protein BCR38DRAFT_145710 [Pseudomassariella vexata]
MLARDGQETWSTMGKLNILRVRIGLFRCLLFSILVSWHAKLVDGSPVAHLPGNVCTLGSFFSKPPFGVYKVGLKTVFVCSQAIIAIFSDSPREAE